MGVEQAVICVDTHTHYYPCYDAETFLSSLQHNLLATARKLGATGTVYPVACMLDSASSTGFADLSAGFLGNTRQLSWSVEHNAHNPAVLHLSRGDGEQLTVIGGRQLVTRENLELILIGRTAPVSPRQSALELLLAYQKRYCAILPWGFGKWLGKRGAIVDELIARNDLVFCLGDNAGRPELWRKVQQFKLAKQYSVPILPGSDALPLASEQATSGNSALILNGALDREKPVEDLANKIRRKRCWLGSQQTTAGLWRTATSQLAMQIPGKH